MTPLFSLNFEGFDPEISLNDPRNLLFTFFNSYGRGHCDPLNRKFRENPAFSDFLAHLNTKQWAIVIVLCLLCVVRCQHFAL